MGIDYFEQKKLELQSELLIVKDNELLLFQKQCLSELRGFCSEVIYNHKAIKNKEKYPILSDYITELENMQTDIELLLFGAKRCKFDFQISFLEVKEMYIRRAILLFKTIAEK